MICSKPKTMVNRLLTRRPELLLLFLLATALVLIVHQYSLAAFGQTVSKFGGSRTAPDVPRKEHAAGHLGEPVTIPQEDMPRAIQEEIALGWQRQGYNQFVSDLISVRREMPDVRDPWCRQRKIPHRSTLPPVSVVIVFHNEALSVLLRTVHSVLQRTPPELVREIVLVDDWSSLVQLKTFLDDYFLPYGDKIRILRTHQRLGLIQGRIFGARRTVANYLLFLDAHCECLEGWLEPLLEVAIEDGVVAVPTIDWLNETTLALQPGLSSGLYGAFDWNLSFQWRPRYDRIRPNPQNPLEPFDSPVMAGGLFCIEKAFFARLGWYDSGMQVYGGENMELSFKVWMCGGSIKIVPCSRVAHIQKRNHPQIGSYIRERELTMKNSLRVAEVWMDEYAEFLYQLHPDFRSLLAPRTSTKRPIEDDLVKRKHLRSQLACRSFRWYLQNVFPEQDDPTQARAMGWLRNENQQHTGICLTWPMRDRSLALLGCHGLGGQQIWFHRATGEITREGHCLMVEDGPQGHLVTMALCTARKETGPQTWEYRRATGQLVNLANGLCLVPTENYFGLAVEPCDSEEISFGKGANITAQRWTFQIDEM